MKSSTTQPLFFILFSVLAITGCNNELPADQYIEWIRNENNGLRITRQTVEHSLILQYEPVPYKALREYKLSSSKEITFNGLEKKFSGLRYFVLKIQRGEKSYNSSLQNDLPAYLVGKFANDLQFIHGDDTIDSPLIHLENPVNLKPYYTVLLAFEEKDPVKDITLLYKGNFFRNEKEIYFKIKAHHINNIPKLIL